MLPSNGHTQLTPLSALLNTCPVLPVAAVVTGPFSQSPCLALLPVPVTGTINLLKRPSLWSPGPKSGYLPAGADKESAPPAARLQLEQEWHAISKARGYPPTFALWLLRCRAFVDYWRGLPPTEWTRDVLQYVQFDADATVRQEASYRAKLTRFQVQQDARHCHSRGGFRTLRPHPRPPFTSTPHCERQTAELVRMDSPSVGLYRVPLPEFVRIGPPTFFEQEEVQVLDKVETPDDDWPVKD